MKNNLRKYQLRKRFSDSWKANKRRLYVWGAFSTLYAGTLYKYKDHKNEIFRIALAGSLSSMIWEVIFHFADTVNIQSKLYSEKWSSMNVYKNIIHQEGINGLCKGISATYYGSIIGGFLYFALYKKLKSYMFSLWDGKIHPWMVFLWSSFLAESLTLSLYYPYNLIKWRLQTSNSRYGYKNLVHAFQKEITENGFLSLYKGWWPFLLMFSTTISLQFTVYELYLRHIKRWHSKSYENHELFHIVNASFIAGVIGHAATNGLEVITVTQQWYPDTKVKSILEKEKFGILTKGIGARVWYQSTQSIVFFSTVAYIGKLFNVQIEE